MRRRKIHEHLVKFLGHLERLIPIDSLIYFSEKPVAPPGRWEDFDVAVISPAFSGMPTAKRNLFLAEYWEPASFYAGLAGFTPEEISDFANPAVQEVLEKGKSLKDTGIFEKMRNSFLTSKEKMTGKNLVISE